MAENENATKRLIDQLRKEQSASITIQQTETVTKTVTTKIEVSGASAIPLASTIPLAEPTKPYNFLSQIGVIVSPYPLIDEAIISRLRENFDDVQERQIIFLQFKQNLEKMRESLPVKKGGKDRALIGLIDAVSNIKSENLTFNQLNAIEKVVKILNKSAELHEKAADECLNILIEADLEPVPKLVGIARYYEA